MSNERERLARQWAESKLAMPTGHLDADVIAAAEHILATTTEPTMADVEWDGDKHFLAGATLDTEESAEEMVMCGFTRDGEIYVVEPNPGRGKRGYWPMPGDLTPNGKKYELVEVTGDEHPETLTTLEDYEDAPAGTIVAAASRHGSMPFPMMKGSDEIWVMMKSVKGRFNYHMAGDKRQVLRWGWGE